MRKFLHHLTMKEKASDLKKRLRLPFAMYASEKIPSELSSQN